MVLSFLFLSSGCSRESSKEGLVPWTGLLDDLVDLERVARLDVPGSSIITSVDPTGGNSDYNHYVRKGPKGWWVLADIQGPGYVSRFWTTGAKPEHRFRFYVDDERRPSIDKEQKELFGDGGLFVSPLATDENGCRNSFLPIPFSKRLVIMAEEGGYGANPSPKLYYQVNYCRDDTLRYARIPKNPSVTDKEVLDVVRRVWTEGDYDNQLPSTEKVAIDVVVGPGESVVLEPVLGPAIIRRFSITPDFSTVKLVRGRERLLRDVIMRVSWDDSQQPSIEVPLGDFFGSFWRRRRFNSMFLGMKEDAFFCRFPMPFKTRAVVSFENQGGERLPMKVEMDLAHDIPEKVDWGYFHSCWNKTGPEDVGRPHPIVKTQGKGRYVGCVLAVASGDGNWWILEGDESVRKDGEVMPSWRGTGLEDYFNGGWYYRNVMVRPLHGLLHQAPFSTIQYRFHLADFVDFEREVAVEFERGPDHASRGWMESTAYYYLDAPSRAISQLGSPESRRPPPDPYIDSTLMKQVIALESLGDIRGARDRVAAYVEGHGDSQFKDIFLLRLLAYKVALGQEKSPNEAYVRFAAGCGSSEAAQQAKLLAWFHESPKHALVAGYCNARSSISIDGTPVMTSDHPEAINVMPTILSPGKHVLTLDCKKTRNGPWVQACIRTHKQIVGTGKEMRWSNKLSEGWQARDYDDTSWTSATAFSKDLPQDPYHVARPNAFVGLQSRTRGLNELWGDDHVFYRLVFEIPR